MFLRRLLCIWITISFLSSLIISPQRTYAQTILNLPEPGTMVSLSAAYAPVLIKGLKINPDNPLAIDFIVATGNSQLTDKDPQLKKESEKLIKYFFAALTLPEKDVWVNLSPYEKDRIIPNSTGETEMGRDMLAQDYILKQLTASLIYPEKGLGKDFWNKVYTEASQRFGTTQIPVNTFNKVWIVADKASVYEARDTVFVVDSHLKVMLEEDYLALNKHRQVQMVNDTHALGSQIVREIVLPALEKEINEGKNFANLRQIFHSLILAKWYKETLKTALLNQVYSNRNKVIGVDVADKTIKDQIYQQYLKAYKKGVFNYIKEDKRPFSFDSSPGDQQPIARKYISGGVSAAMIVTKATAKEELISLEGQTGRFIEVASRAVISHAAHAAMINSANGDTTSIFKKNKLGTTPQLGLTPQGLAEKIQRGEPIPLITTVSDQHGTIDKFDFLLVDMFRSVPAGQRIPEGYVLNPDQTIAEQFEKLGIKLTDFKGQLFIHNLGDFMDRGPYGVKVFYRSKELVDEGLSDFVIGNHDQWMFMNLIGFHLPYYNNFEFYGYKDSYNSKKGGGDVRFLLKQKHQEDPETLKPDWWARKLAEHRKFYGNLQKTRWASTDKEVNGPEGLYEQVTRGMDEDTKKMWSRSFQGEVWNKLRGYNPEVGEVATGVKAVGLVSIVWWEKLLKEFKATNESLYPHNKAPTKEKDLAVYEAWQTAINLMEHRIIPELKKVLEEKINPTDGSEPQWWYRIFEAINSQNYTSPEWWAQDWAYHQGWGPTVFKEINNTYHAGQDVLTVENYLDAKSGLKGTAVLKEIAKFFKEHYSLHTRDIMQTDLMHGFLPIDTKTGEFYFNYKTVHYRGVGGDGYQPYWEGLESIARDVRNAPDDESLIRTVYEAKTVVNGWYADNTTEAKAIHIATAFKNIGVKTIASANGIHRLITGHVPMHDFLKLPEDLRRIITGHFISTEDRTRTFADSDGGMGEKFGGGGKYIRQGMDGFVLRGFPSKRSTKIIDNPPTIIFKKNGTEGDVERLVYRNDDPVPSGIFLSSVLDSIRSAELKNSAMATSDRTEFLKFRRKIMPNVPLEEARAAWRERNGKAAPDLHFGGAMTESPKGTIYLPTIKTPALPSVRLPGNLAMKTQAKLTPGGIDLNASKLNLQKSGAGMDIKFDPALIAQFKMGNFDGIVPVITGITPIPDIYPVLGLKVSQGNEKTAVL